MSNNVIFVVQLINVHLHFCDLFLQFFLGVLFLVVGTVMLGRGKALSSDPPPLITVLQGFLYDELNFLF